MVRNTVSIEKKLEIFSLQHQCCAVLGKFIVGLFVYILPISQTNHEECCGFVNFFFHLNYPLHNNVWPKTSTCYFVKLVFLQMCFLFITAV